MIEIYFFLLYGFPFINSSPKSHAMKHEKMQFITIKSSPKLFVFSLELEDSKNDTPFKSFSSFQLIKLTASKCIEFESSREMGNTNQIKHVFNFIKIEVVLDEKNDILNGTVITVVNIWDAGSEIRNKDKKIDSEFLFNVHKGQINEDSNIVSMNPSIRIIKQHKLSKMFKKPLVMDDIHVMNSDPVNTDTILFTSSEEGFLESKNKSKKRLFCHPDGSIFKGNHYESIKKKNGQASRLFFKSLPDQMFSSIFLHFSYFKTIEGHPNPWIEKLKTCIDSVFQEEKFTGIVRITTLEHLTESNFISYIKLLSQVKKYQKSVSLYGDAFYLILWSSPQILPLNIDENRRRLFFNSLLTFLKGNLFILVILIFLCIFKVVEKEKILRMVSPKNHKKENLKKPNEKKTPLRKKHSPLNITNLENNHILNSQIFRFRITKTIMEHVHTLSEDERRKALKGNHASQRGIISANNFLHFTAEKFLEWFSSNEKANNSDKESSNYNLYFDQAIKGRIIGFLEDLRDSNTCKFPGTPFNNEKFEESMKFFYYICSFIYFHVKLGTQKYKKIRKLRKVLMEFLIEEMLVENLGTIGEDFVLRGPENETISQQNIVTAIAVLKSLFRKLSLKPSPFFKRLKDVLHISSLRESQ